MSGSHSAERLLHTRPREVPPGVLPSMSADVACGMVSGTLASGTSVMLSGGEVRIDLIELRRPGFTERWVDMLWRVGPLFVGHA